MTTREETEETGAAGDCFEQKGPLQEYIEYFELYYDLPLQFYGE